MRANRQHRRPTTAGARGAFTLLEILLVMGVMVVAIGLAWPAIAVIQGEYRLRQGGQLVQAKLAWARLHAVETGHVYQFCFEPGGRKFIILPRDQEANTAQAGPGTRAPQKVGGSLPAENVHFDGTGVTTQTLPPEWLAGMTGEGNFTTVSWSAPILFYPDGSASSATLQIVDKKSRTVTVSVRPLTGAVSVSKIQSGTSR
ncbi:MAG: GspH/FimT family pseudopilin [Planctomycetia bacterium]|nr:GspH/FimT family pseudopilin [Planctomycetia bacterium]